MPQPRNSSTFPAEALLAMMNDPQGFEEKLRKLNDAQQAHDAAYERAKIERIEAQELLGKAEKLSRETESDNAKEKARIERSRESLETFRAQMKQREASLVDKENDLAARHSACNTREVELETRASHLNAQKDAINDIAAKTADDRATLEDEWETLRAHKAAFETKSQKIMVLLKEIS